MRFCLSIIEPRKQNWIDLTNMLQNQTASTYSSSRLKQIMPLKDGSFFHDVIKSCTFFFIYYVFRSHGTQINCVCIINYELSPLYRSIRRMNELVYYAPNVFPLIENRQILTNFICRWQKLTTLISCDSK